MLNVCLAGSHPKFAPRSHLLLYYLFSVLSLNICRMGLLHEMADLRTKVEEFDYFFECR